MTYPATDKIDTITTCRLPPAVLKHREYRGELCLNSLNSLCKVVMPMIRGRQKCPASGSEPQSTPAAPNRPPASAQCRTCKGPCTLAGGSPRARATCRACLASPDASRRALSGLGRTISPRDRRREREARTCTIAFVGSIHHAGACKLTHGTLKKLTKRGKGKSHDERRAGAETKQNDGAPR